MRFRVSRKLRSWVETGLKSENFRHTSDKEITAVLRWDERHGYAMRTLDRHGRIVWKATPKLFRELADIEGAK